MTEAHHICSECGSGFGSASHLAKHRLDDHGLTARGSIEVHRCQRCGQTFDSRPALAEHLRTVHDLGRWRAEAEAGGAPPSDPMPSTISGRRRSTASEPTKKQKISQAGDRTDAGLACPKCGGTQFKVKRSTGRKLGALAAAPVTLGASAVIVAKGTQVRCVTCGTVFRRG